MPAYALGSSRHQRIGLVCGFFRLSTSAAKDSHALATRQGKAKLACWEMGLTLYGKRVTLRPLRESDFAAWHEVRKRNGAWLTRWEPRPPESFGDPIGKRMFISRCVARDAEARIGGGFAFGIFLGETFVGEANLSNIQRGPLQGATIGYWVDEAYAGQGLVPESVAAIFRFAFEELRLHRIQISIVPRNAPSLRVVAKLQLRQEGLAERYIEINGTWEDHALFAITAEEWQVKRSFYMESFLGEGRLDHTN